MSDDVERWVCGFAIVFGEATEDGRGPMSAAPFRFLTDGAALPLMVDHQPVVSPHGVRRSVGRAFRFAIVEHMPHVPAGVLALAAVDADEVGDSVLAAARRGQFGGFSFGGFEELSLTFKPAFWSAKVLGVGQDAAAAWGLLTGTPAIGHVPATPPRQDQQIRVPRRADDETPHPRLGVPCGVR